MPVSQNQDIPEPAAVPDGEPEQTPEAEAPAGAAADATATTKVGGRYRLTIAYDGSAFHGWQKQTPPPGRGEPPRTVAGELEPLLARLLRQPITLVGASRTDAGVHAMGQVAHFDASEMRVPVERLAEAINSRLPKDIEVRVAERVADDFHATRDARCKQYRYRLWNATHRPLAMRHTVYHHWAGLDIDRMNDAAGRLVGTHDFEGLAAAGHGRASTVRTIFDCHVEMKSLDLLSVGSVDAGRLVEIVVQGDGFLYNMVRILAGTLVEVGRGRFEPQQVDRILETADRREAGPTLPPDGLCLEWIRYPS